MGNNMLLPSDAIRWIRMHRTHLKGDLETEYWIDVRKDFDQIEPHLPEKISSILDIGCGLAGIDVLLAKRYPYATIALLDGDGDESNWRPGYASTMGPFSSRKVAESVLELNGVRRPLWKDVGTQEVLEADLIISLLSWGFHYPLSTYRTNGLHITDLRSTLPIKGKVIASTQKYNRCIWR